MPEIHRTAIPAPHAEIATYSKLALHALADCLLKPEPWGIEQCIQFFLAETRGTWHGRARSMMARRLKHCSLGRTHRTQVVTCIADRLEGGNFAEQLKDQLRLALLIDRETTLAVSQMLFQPQRPRQTLCQLDNRS